MGKFKDVGEPAAALSEECAEVIQILSKKQRFSGEWDEIPEDNKTSRWEQLEAEMSDLLYQWERLKAQREYELFSLYHHEHEKIQAALNNTDF